MINNVPKPEISRDFTIEDIHKIREWHYERRKDMTPEEIIDDTRKGADRIKALLAQPADPAVAAEVDRRIAEAKILRKAKESVAI